MSLKLKIVSPEKLNILDLRTGFSYREQPESSKYSSTMHLSFLHWNKVKLNSLIKVK